MKNITDTFRYLDISVERGDTDILGYSFGGSHSCTDEIGNYTLVTIHPFFSENLLQNTDVITI